MGNPLVSIIIPTYNRKSDLSIALNSAMKQSYENIEIVISDDSSTDGTDIFIKEYLSNPKIKYFRNDNNLSFAGNHRKAIIDYAKGRYSLILSDDDYFLDNNYLLKAVDFFLNNNGLSFVGSDFQMLDVVSNKKKIISPQLDKITTGINYLLKRTDLRFGGIFVGTVLFDREKAISVDPFSEEVPYADGEFIDKLALVGEVGYIKTTSINYNVHKNNWSTNKESNINKRMEEFDCADRVVNFSREKEILDKSIEKYRENYYKLVALKIYKEGIKENPLNIVNLLRLKKLIKNRTNKSYLFFLFNRLANKIYG